MYILSVKAISMRQLWRYIVILFFIIGVNTMLFSSNLIPANHPYIQYFGRWDVGDSLHPRHSWPGTYLYAEFSGRSVGIRLADHINYYNVYIDGRFHKVFHGTQPGESDYLLIDSLEEGHHTFLFSKRNIAFDTVFTFSGLLLDDGAVLFPPPAKPTRRIEFIGDSFTAAESNEATAQELPWEERFPVTNIDKGFASFVARHFNADYHTICRSGSGMICDWRGDFNVSIPKIFDRALMEDPEPKWNFTQWIPDLVVICLGLNDYSGLKDKDGNVSDDNSSRFRNGYIDFLITISKVYPGVKILAVAPFPEWIKRNVKQLVDEEIQNGYRNIYYTNFDEFPGGYVANGHPTVETHRKIADQIISAIELYHIFTDKK
jgi:hypothetical protein